jgi:hypothetical protein
MHRLLQKALDDIDSSTAGMTEEDLRCHPEGKWCAAEVLEHLALTFEHTVRGMNRCLAAGKNLGDQPSLKQRLFHAVVLDFQHFPTGRKSPELVDPQGKLGGLEALEKVRANLIAMDQKLNECREKLGSTGRLANHPVLGPLSNEQWCTFHYVHTRHHMKQVRALRQRAKAQAAG